MDQLDLFFRRPAVASPLADRVAREHAEAAEIAARLPSGLRFGTSSWSFSGWAGIVYSRRAETSDLAREGLREYARHPLLTTVGIDRGFYAPIPEADLARYASQLPRRFPCCAKAPQAVTAAVLDGRTNPDFLRAERFVDEMLAPFARVFAEHCGPFLIQLPPPPPARFPDPRELAPLLDAFLAALPREFRYAVELRDPRLVTREYRDVLARRGAAHVYNWASRMPSLSEQQAAVPVSAAPFTVIRLLLRPGTLYDDRREEFLPFDRIVEVDEAMRADVAGIARSALALGREVFVLVNNKAEGCAPLTIRALAEMLADG